MIVIDSRRNAGTAVDKRTQTPDDQRTGTALEKSQRTLRSFGSIARGEL
jgi:hypothetical protein